MKRIGVLALQGDFLEHEAALRRLGVEPVEVRLPAHLRDLDGVIIPGGESTTFCRVMEDFDLYEPLRAAVRTGMPVWGTCAGLIILAKRVDDLPFPTLEALDIGIKRNAYGRQTESFEAEIDIPAVGGTPFHAVFIRAPVVSEVGSEVEVLARLPAGGSQGQPVAVRQRQLMATTFHPELTGDDRLHKYFLGLVEAGGRHAPPK